VLAGKKRSPGRGFKRDTKLTKEIIDDYPRSQWWIFAVENDRTMRARSHAQAI